MDIGFGDVDTGIADENLAIAVQGLGLGSVILGMPGATFNGERGTELQKRLGINSKLEFKIGIAIGHPAAGKEPHTTEESHIISV